MISGDRKKLAEAVKHLRTNQDVGPEQVECTLPRHPFRDFSPAWEHMANGLSADVLCAVKASLRARVAALAEDNWKFEAEPQPRH